MHTDRAYAPLHLPLLGWLALCTACGTVPVVDPPEEPLQEPAAQPLEEPLAQPEAIQEEAPAAQEQPAADPVEALSPSLPLVAVDATLLLRVGRPIPPGLPSTRAAERERERAVALAELQLQMSPEHPLRPSWLARLELLLGGVGTPSDQWSGAAFAVGQSGEYGLAPLLARGLPWSGRPLRQVSSRAALYELYGHWFKDAAEFEAYPERQPSSPGSAALHRVHHELAEQLYRARARSLSLEPELALAALAGQDPRLRGAAAGSLAAAVAAGELAAGGVFDRLLPRLAMEPEAAAFAATLDACLLALDSQGAPEDGVERLLSVLAAVMGRGLSGLELPVARSLGRLSWAGEAAGAADPGQGVELLTGMLGRMEREGEGADPDVVVQTLDALSGLCSRAGRASLAEVLSRPDSLQPVKRLVAQVGSRPLGVRAAAARTFAQLASASDTSWLVGILRDPLIHEELRYALLDSLRAIASEGPPDLPPTELEALYVALRTSVRGGGVDLARRALELLAEPALDALLAGRDLSWLLEELEEQALRAPALALLRKAGDRELLGALLVHPSTSTMVAGEPEELAEIAGLMRALADGDPGSLFESARALAAVERSGSRNAQLVWALRLAADVDAEAAGALTPEQHRAILSWALDLRRAGLSLDGAPLPEGGFFLRRLVEVHLPAVAPTPDLGAGALEHARGLFLSDLFATDGTPEEEQEVRGAFAGALAAAGRDAGFAARVRRDRARFLLLSADEAGALADYRPLLFGPDAEGEPSLQPDELLEPSDLRAAASLLGAEAETPSAGQAFDVLESLVARSTWLNAAGALRLQDLENMCTHAETARDRARLERFGLLLAGLPEAGEPAPEDEQAESPDEPDSEPALPPAPPPGAGWGGLVEDSEQLTRLHELRGRASDALATLSAPPETTPEAPGEPGDTGAAAPSADPLGRGSNAPGRP